MGFAEQDLGAAGLAEEFEGELRPRGVLFDLYGVAGVGGEHEQLAAGHLALQRLGELQAVLARHGDIAEEESGGEGSSTSQTFCRGVNRFGLVAVGLKDQIESIGY